MKTGSGLRMIENMPCNNLDKFAYCGAALYGTGSELFPKLRGSLVPAILNQCIHVAFYGGDGTACLGSDWCVYVAFDRKQPVFIFTGKTDAAKQSRIACEEARCTERTDDALFPSQENHLRKSVVATVTANLI